MYSIGGYSLFDIDLSLIILHITLVHNNSYQYYIKKYFIDFSIIYFIN